MFIMVVLANWLLLLLGWLAGWMTVVFVKQAPQKVNTPSTVWAAVSKGIRGVTLIIIPHKQWTAAILCSQWGLVSAINFSYLRGP